MPVYRVEKYLKKCVDSILHQTYRNLEIILVDDGSPDRCPKICDEYEEKESRIKVIHKENGGLSDARNAGIEAATGTYIGFVDSDDYISSDMYETLYRLIDHTGAQVAVCNFYWARNETARPFSLPFQDSALVLDRMEAAKELLLDRRIQNYVWNKLYRADLFDGIRYPVGKCFEDIYTTYCLILKSSKVAITAEPKYYYWQREDSICGIMSSQATQDSFHARQERLFFIKENYPGLEKYCYRLIAKNFIGTFGSMANQGVIFQNRAFLDAAKICIAKEYRAIFRNSFVPVIDKIAIGILLVNESTYWKLRRSYLRIRDTKS